MAITDFTNKADVDLPSAYNIGSPIENAVQNLNFSQQERKRREIVAQALVAKFDNCKAGKGRNLTFNTPYWGIFEDLCIELMNTTLKDDFLGLSIDPQSRTLRIIGFKQDIKDLVLLNNPKEQHGNCVWNILKHQFMCNQIIFDCKNYAKKNCISSEDVYQLFQYLGGEVGRFGIIISRYSNMDSSARSALSRIAQEKYLIVVIGDKEIREWLQVYIEDSNSTRFFRTLYNKNNGRIKPFQKW